MAVSRRFESDDSLKKFQLRLLITDAVPQCDRVRLRLFDDRNVFIYHQRRTVIHSVIRRLDYPR